MLAEHSSKEGRRVRLRVEVLLPRWNTPYWLRQLDLQRGLELCLGGDQGALGHEPVLSHPKARLPERNYFTTSLCFFQCPCCHSWKQGRKILSDLTVRARNDHSGQALGAERRESDAPLETIL